MNPITYPALMCWYHEPDISYFEGTILLFPLSFDNNIRGRSNVKVWLDRAVATPDWKYIFKESRVQHHVSRPCEHCLIYVCLMQEDKIGRAHV